MGRQRGVQYRPGSFYRSDDRSGFTRRSEQTQKEWNGLIVGENLWEIRQPQDFVRGVPDDQTVPEPRPVPANVFVGPFSVQIQLPGLVGDHVLFLQNVIGIQVGDPVGIFTELESYFYTHIASIDYVTNSVTLVDALPLPVPAKNLLTDFINPKIVISGDFLTTEDGTILTTEGGTPITVESAPVTNIVTEGGQDITTEGGDPLIT